MLVHLRRHVKLYACFWGMFVCAWNDILAPSVLPYMQTYYKMTYMRVATLFIPQASGFIIAALAADTLTRRFGRTKVIVGGALCPLIPHIAISCVPPFPVIPATYVFIGIGFGMPFGLFNIYVSSLPEPHQKLGFMHAFYGLGNLVGPFVSTAFVSRGIRFTYVYTVAIGFTLLNAAFLAVAFGGNWEGHVEGIGASESPSQPAPALLDKSVPVTPTTTSSLDMEKQPPAIATNIAPSTVVMQGAAPTQSLWRNPLLWLFGAIWWLFVGMEFALAGWCLNYLIDLKGGTESCGYVLSAYYALFTLGRVALPKVNEAIGQERSLLIYLVICHLLAIGMWQFDNLVASAAMIVLFGLCIGPIGVVLLSVILRTLPEDVKVRSLGFLGSFAMSGSAVFPFFVGALSSKYGIRVLPPLMLGLSATSLVLCVMVWRISSTAAARRPV